MPSIDLSDYKKTVKRPAKAKKQQESFSLSDFLNKDISFSGKQLGDKKRESFYMELSTLLLSGVDIRTAMELIVVEQPKEKDKELFKAIQAGILNGSALSDAMQTTGKFSQYEYFSLRIGEETGRIGEVLADLAIFFKTKIAQRRKIISAVTYPFIVLSTSLGAVFFMLKFVVPMFADVFQRFGGKLPLITSVILKFSAFSDSYFKYFFFFLIAVALFFIFNKKKDWFRNISSSLVLTLPLVGDIVCKIYLARFANTMRLLVLTDTPLLKSIALVRQMIGFYPLEKSLEEVEKCILKGDSLHKSLSAFGFYPPKFVQLIKVGEEVNRLGYFFEKIATQYTEEVEYKTGTISSLLEPLIIIFLGIVVGVILIAMYLPMFQMSNSF